MDKKKILITGYPHTGTSILKSKLGECKNVYEVIDEDFEIRSNDIVDSGDKEFILIKTPVIPLEIRVHGVTFLTKNNPTSIYKDYNIIFVTRNPWNLFTSVIKAGDDPLSHEQWHLSPKYPFTIEEYFVSLDRYIEARDGNFPKIHTIKYEELFENNNQKIKSIMDDIGLIYDENIFETKTKEYKFKKGIRFNQSERPKEYNRIEMRTWQLNQPFQNMNGDVDIPEELNKILSESDIVKQLGYTDPRITD